MYNIKEDLSLNITIFISVGACSCCSINGFMIHFDRGHMYSNVEIPTVNITKIH